MAENSPAGFSDWLHRRPPPIDTHMPTHVHTSSSLLACFWLSSLGRGAVRVRHHRPDSAVSSGSSSCSENDAEEMLEEAAHTGKNMKLTLECSVI